jgi:YggT family protein
VLYTVLLLLLVLLFARAVISFIVPMGRYRPTGYMAVLFEVIYTITDVPLRPLERLLPPIRIGSVSFSLGFLVLVLAISILLSQVQHL